MKEIKTAATIRYDMADSQRMEKTRTKWFGWCNTYKERSLITGNNKISIGDKVDYTVRKKVGRCVQISAKTGIVFAFNDSGSNMAVITMGRIYAVRNLKEAEG